MKHITNWLKIVSGIICALALLEIGLRVVDVDTLNVWNPHTVRGRELYQTHPQIGWVLKPNLRTSWEIRDGFDVEIETNAMGLRDTEHPYQKPDGVFRILLLGDSFAEALQLPLEDIFPTTLETCLNSRASRPVEVINAGMTAYSIGDNYRYYLVEGKKYQPDLVLVSLFTEYALLDLDRHDNQTMVQIAGSYRYDLENNRLKKTWVGWESPEQPIGPVETFLRKYSRIYKILWHPHAKLHQSLADLSGRIQARLSLAQSVAGTQVDTLPWHLYVFSEDFSHNPSAPPLLQDRWQVFQALFNRFHREVSADGRTMAVLVIPNKYQAHRRFREARIQELASTYSNLSDIRWDLEHEPDRTFTEFFRQSRIPALDLLPYFQAHDANNGYSLYYDIDLHLNREGHYMTRDLLCNWLVDNRLVPQ